MDAAARQILDLMEPGDDALREERKRAQLHELALLNGTVRVRPPLRSGSGSGLSTSSTAAAHAAFRTVQGKPGKGPQSDINLLIAAQSQRYSIGQPEEH